MSQGCQTAGQGSTDLSCTDNTDFHNCPLKEARALVPKAAILSRRIALRDKGAADARRSRRLASKPLGFLHVKPGPSTLMLLARMSAWLTKEPQPPSGHTSS